MKKTDNLTYKIGFIQPAIYNHQDVFEGLGFQELCILDWMLTFAANNIEKKMHEGIVYYWFDYQYIINCLPILFARVGSPKNIGKNSAYKKVKILVDRGLLVPHPKNQAKGKSFYAFSDNAMLLKQKVSRKKPIKPQKSAKEMLGKLSEDQQDARKIIQVKEDLRGKLSEEKPIYAENYPKTPIYKEDSVLIDSMLKEDTVLGDFPPKSFKDIVPKKWEEGFRLMAQRCYGDDLMMWTNASRFYAQNIFYHVRRMLEQKKKNDGNPYFHIKDAEVLIELESFFANMPKWVIEKNYFSMKYLYDNFNKLYKEAKQLGNGSEGQTDFDRDFERRLAQLSS